jgi:hypothetical protein
LNEEPTHPRFAGLGGGPAAVALPGAGFARPEAEGGFDVVRVAEALGVVEGRDEGGGGHGPDAGDGAQALDALS